MKKYEFIRINKKSYENLGNLKLDGFVSLGNGLVFKAKKNIFFKPPVL